MPTYNYECAACSNGFEELIPLAQYQEPQPCPECGELAPRVLGAFPGTVFRGDGWATKNNRVAGQMAERRKRAGAKERDLKGDGMVPTLAPNVGGERTDSWSEASRLAKSKGKNTSGYDQRARKETKSA